MTHSKIFIRESGLKYRVEVRLYIEFAGDVSWKVQVMQCLPKKRTWTSVHDSQDYRFRRLDMSERQNHIIATNLQHVTEGEIMQIKLELWEKIKPV